MTLIKNIVSLCAVTAGFIPFIASAEVKDLHSLVDFNSDVQVAAHALVERIKADPNNNHSPVPGHNAYKDLRIVSVEPEYTGSVEIDDATQTLKHFEVQSVSFEAHGVPLFSKYVATVKLSADFTPDCQIVEGSRSYKVTKSNSSLVDALFNKDLTGRNYNSKYEAYGDVVFRSMIETSAALRTYCQSAQ